MGSISNQWKNWILLIGARLQMELNPALTRVKPIEVLRTEALLFFTDLNWHPFTCSPASTFVSRQWMHGKIYGDITMYATIGFLRGWVIKARIYKYGDESL